MTTPFGSHTYIAHIREYTPQGICQALDSRELGTRSFLTTMPYAELFKFKIIIIVKKLTWLLLL